MRVVIADGQLLLPEAVRALLEPDPDIEVVGVAYEADRVLALVGELKPDLLLLGFDMPGIDRLAFLDRLLASYPRLATVLLAKAADPALESSALAHGARGVVVKGSDPAELAPALRTAIPKPERRGLGAPEAVLARPTRKAPRFRVALEAAGTRLDELRARIERAVFGNDYDWL